MHDANGYRRDGDGTRHINRRADLLQVLQSDADLALHQYRVASERSFLVRGDGRRVYLTGRSWVGSPRTRAEAVATVAWRAYEAALERFYRAHNMLVVGESFAMAVAA